MSTPQTELAAAVAAVLAEADAEIAGNRPVCRASGKCCRFEEYGHRLYVTAAELVHFAHAIEAQSGPGASPQADKKSVSLPQFFSQDKPRGCPYQVDGLCTARDARPLGCRVYFCDANAQAWQNDLYERYHDRLQKLHGVHGIAYRYVEWRAGLRELMEDAGG